MKRKNTSAHLLDKSLLSVYLNFKTFLDKNLKSKKFVGDIVNVGSNNYVSIADLYSKIQKI